MSAMRPSVFMPGAPNGYGSCPSDNLPEWHDFGRYSAQSSNNPLGTSYVQCGPLAPRMKPEYVTIEEWRTHNLAQPP